MKVASKFVTRLIGTVELLHHVSFHRSSMHCISVEEMDIIELEKHYWGLRSQSKTGRVDLQTFKATVCPPLPESLVEGSVERH